MRGVNGISLIAVGVALAGCSARNTQPFSKISQVETNLSDPWVLATSDPNHSTPALLWNGNVGFRIGRAGSPLLLNRTQLSAYSIDRYQPDGEEKIIPLDEWFDTRAAQPPFDPKEIRSYRQELDLRTGILETSWIIADRKREIHMIRETILDPYGPPVWGERWAARIASSSELHAGEEGILQDSYEKTQYIPSSLDDGNPPADDFKAIRTRAEEFWQEFWQTDIEIDGPIQDQQAIRSFLYYLRTAIHPNSDRAVSPLGLSGSTYFGHVFWDADMWVFPALMLLDPERAATIPNYRLSKVRGARENYLRWVREGRPVGKGEPMGTKPPSSIAIMFPWESSESGRETVPGSSRFQHHISSTVVHGLELAEALGLVEKEKVHQVGQGVAAFLLDRGEARPDGALNFRATMSPDEHHTGNNDLFTNIVSNEVIQRYGPKDAPKFVLPRDETSLISYEGDRFKGYKQAAGVLSIYPLQFPEAEASALTLMQRMEGGVIQNGPAMTDSVHATIHARFGDSADAYAIWRKSWQDFTNHPLLLFSEKPKKEVTYFTTGAGGALQTVLFGFAGLRIDEKALPDSKWTRDLEAGMVLSCKPNLPPSWKRLTIRKLRVGDDSYDLVITSDEVMVSKHSSR